MAVQPTSSTTLQRPDLGELAYEYMESPAGFGMMGLDILPVYPVAEKSADYPVIPTEAMMKVQNVLRNSRGHYNRSNWEYETKTYACVEKGWEEVVPDDEARDYSRLFDLEMASSERALYVINLALEVEIAAAIYNATTFASATAAVTTEWSTITATPRADVKAAKQAMLIYPDSIAMSLKVFENLLNITEVRNALQYTNPIELGGLEAQRRIIAQYLGLDNVFVSNAKKDSTKKGQSTTVADVWDDEYVFIFKRATQRTMREPALGRTFLWTADSPTLPVVEQYREEQGRGSIIRVRHHTDPKIQFATGAGYLLSNITA